MKLYFASGPYLTYVDQLRRVQETTSINPFPARILISYLDLRKRSLSPLLERYFQPGEVELFMDSGAFGAYNARIILDVNAYGQWIMQNQEWIHVYANLDVKHSAAETERNQKTLEDMGLSPLPVYHGAEPINIWEKMTEKYDYACLGGIVGMRRMSSAMTKLHLCAKIARENNCKVHMFGVGTPKILSKINFYSADSTSFIQSRYGRVIIWDERTMDTVKIRRRSRELIMYEHLFSRYNLETAPLFMNRPGRYGYSIIRAFEYLQFMRMEEWLDAIWNARERMKIS